MLSNTEITVGVVVVLALLFLLGRNIIKMNRAQTQVEGLCIRPSGSCRDYNLVDALGQPYAPPTGHGVEPSDPATLANRLMTSSMVIPETLPQDHETAKTRFLTNANLVYLDWENDQINKELLPPKTSSGHGLLFAV